MHLKASDLCESISIALSNAFIASSNLFKAFKAMPLPGQAIEFYELYEVAALPKVRMRTIIVINAN